MKTVFVLFALLAVACAVPIDEEAFTGSEESTELFGTDSTDDWTEKVTEEDFTTENDATENWTTEDATEHEDVTATEDATENWTTEGATDLPISTTSGPIATSTCRCILQPSMLLFHFNSKLYVDELMSKMSATGYSTNDFECNKEGVAACQKVCAAQVSSMTNNLDLKFQLAPGKSIAQAVCDKIDYASFFPSPRWIFPSRLWISGEMTCTQGTSTWTSATFTNEFGSDRTFTCPHGKARIF